MLLRELKNGLVHLFYPRLCEGCSMPLVGAEWVLCMSCGLQLPETNYHDMTDNESALRFAGRIPFCRATSYAYFTNNGLLQHLLHGLKYKDRQETGLFLGERFGRSLQAVNWADDIDLIIPVPLHPKKQASRGYNQSLLIAEGMAGVLAIPASDKILCRVRDTESQTHKTRIERVSNMEAAFAVNNGSSLNGKHILLCDDVLTTGATIEACALELLKHGNIKISVATIGIAVS